MQIMVGNNYGSYSFVPGGPGAGTITLLGLPSAFSQNQLKLIVDAATNTILFNLADPTLTATVAGNVITLAANTSTLHAGDPLQIFMEVPATDGTVLDNLSVTTMVAGLSYSTIG